MEQLLNKLGINANQSSEQILEELEKKQMEYLDRLDNVEDDRRREQLKDTLQEIESAISTLSWLVKRTTTGIKRDTEDTEEAPEEFSDLKKKGTQKQNEVLQADRTQKAPEKTEEERYDEALAIMATPDYAKGVELMHKLAEEGYHWAQREMGRLYSEGNRVEKNDQIAVEWYQKAAEQGNAEAQNCLGDRYLNGQGVAQNDQLAVEWYQKAADQGNASAQLSLGWMYEVGRGVVQNDQLAVEWYQKAAGQGNAGAQCNLGWMYESGRGVVQNYRLAAEWYQKAANQGNARAQSKLGMMYENGRGVVQNDKLAVEWYRKAADQGYVYAQYSMAWAYDKGQGVTQNDRLAAEWYEKAANQGDAESQCNLGWMYEHGRGVEQNYYMATKWYLKAAGQGNTQAQNNLDIVKNMEDNLNAVCTELLYRTELNGVYRDYYGVSKRVKATKSCKTVCELFQTHGLISTDEKKEVKRYKDIISVDLMNNEDINAYNGLLDTINKRYRDYLGQFKRQARYLDESGIFDSEAERHRKKEGGIPDIQGYIESLERNAR